MATTVSSFTALPDDVLQRVLLGVALDDHDATAAACRAFRKVIRGPQFPALRRRYGFAERGIILVGEGDGETLEVHVAGKHGAAILIGGLRMTFRGSTTDGGTRLFVTAMRDSGPPVVLALDGTSCQWSHFATLPLHLRNHCIEWHGGRLYVAGGKGEGYGTFCNHLKAFDETTGLWEDLPPMSHACAFAASGVIGNQLFIAGGVNGVEPYLSTIQIYDFATRTWRLGATLPHADHGGWGVVVGDGKLYLVRRPGTTRSMFVYDVESNTWSNQPKPPYQGADVDVKYAFAHKGRIVAVNTNGCAFQRGVGSDWSEFDLGVRASGKVVAGSVILG